MKSKFYYLTENMNTGFIFIIERKKCDDMKDSGITVLLKSRLELKNFLKIYRKGKSIWLTKKEKNEAKWIEKHYNIPYSD